MRAVYEKRRVGARELQRGDARGAVLSGAVPYRAAAVRYDTPRRRYVARVAAAADDVHAVQYIGRTRPVDGIEMRFRILQNGARVHARERERERGGMQA